MTVYAPQNLDDTELTWHDLQAYYTEMAQTCVLDWDHEDTRPSLEIGLNVSKAKAMVQLKAAAPTLTSQEIWEAMNPTARKATLGILDQRLKFREVRAERAEEARTFQEEVDAVDRSNERLQALVRTARKHAVGVKSEEIRMHVRFVEAILGDDRRTEPDAMGWYPAFQVDGLTLTPHLRFDEESAWAFCLHGYNGHVEHAKDRLEYLRSIGCVNEHDELRYFRSGKKHPNRQVAYIAPMSLSDDQADVYERLRADGLSPTDAEQAAQLV